MESYSGPVVVGVADKQPTALRVALGEAHRRNTGLQVVHSTGMPAHTVSVHGGVGLFDELRTAGQQVLDQAQHFLEQEVTPVHVSYVLANAPAIDVLESAAQAASILVVGADNVSWPDRLLGGAVASHVAMHAACPVIVVPERAYPTPLTGGVVIALDGDSPARGPIQFAFEQATTRGNVLHVIQAIPPGTIRPDAEAVRAEVGQILAGWSSTYPGVRTQVSFPVGNRDGACSRAAERAELVVVERPVRHALRFVLARPLAAGIIRRARCPVVVVPADYRVS